jgi:hypothetical protein
MLLAADPYSLIHSIASYTELCSVVTTLHSVNTKIETFSQNIETRKYLIKILKIHETKRRKMDYLYQIDYRKPKTDTVNVRITESDIG